MLKRGGVAGKVDPEATIVVRPVGLWRRVYPLLGAGVLVLGAAGGAYNLWRSSPAAIAQPPAVDAAVPRSLPPLAGATAPPPPVSVAPAVVPVVATVGGATAAFPVTLASEAEILADRPTDMTVFRFKSNPTIVVLDFASLAEQGAMLNRMAVFEEKDGYPHDRLLSDAELDKAIRNGGDEPATFYYGHDYRADALIRFFSIADRDHVALTAQEQRLHALMAQLGWTGPGAVGGLISLPKLAADSTIDARSRATILRHELSHGEYFTNPTYAAFSRHFWRDLMTDGDRAGFRRFLIADHYDGAIEDLMINEGQAYLMHTADPRFFSAQFVGLTDGRIDDLRQMFLAGMPKGWLREATLPPPMVTPASAAAPRAAP